MNLEQQLQKKKKNSQCYISSIVPNTEMTVSAFLEQNSICLWGHFRLQGREERRHQFKNHKY